MEFAIQTELTENESIHLFKWNERVFPVEGQGFTWGRPTHHIVVRDEGLPIGHIGFAASLVVGATEHRVIGVGGVVVRPEYQGLKIPEKMFKILNTTEVLAAGRTVKTLFCPKRLTSYYEKHGYEEFRHGFRFLQQEGYRETDKFQFMVRGSLGESCALSIPSYPW